MRKREGENRFARFSPSRFSIDSQPAFMIYICYGYIRYRYMTA